MVFLNWESMANISWKQGRVALASEESLDYLHAVRKLSISNVRQIMIGPWGHVFT